MFVLNKRQKMLSRVKAATFSQLGIKERPDLQEWIAHNTDILGEELLVIQKEFAGFDKTKERLDLLALDKQGNLVIIENKLDDTGRDVTWQVLKYASYCSSLTNNQIVKIYQDYLNKEKINCSSEDNLTAFFKSEGFNEFDDVILNKNQRIIMISNSYRDEVTSSVLWLLSKYNMRIQCFKITPYPFNDNILIDVEQIIPVKEAQDYMIKMAEKAIDEQSSQNEMKERYRLRLEFWKLLLKEFNKKSQLYANVNPTKDAWISAGSGCTGVGFNFVVSKKYARSEVYISRSNADVNKYIFDILHNDIEKIEKAIPGIEWERLDDKKASRIKVENRDLSLFRKEDWDKMIKFMAENMLKIEKIFGPLVANLKGDKKLAKKAKDDDSVQEIYQF